MAGDAAFDAILEELARPLPARRAEGNRPGTDAEADLEISALGSTTSTMVLGITLDGKEEKLEIPAGERVEYSIAYPSDGKDHELKVQILSSTPESDFDLVSYTVAVKTK